MPFDHLDGVVDAFNDVGAQRRAAVGKDAWYIGFEAPGEGLECADTAAQGPPGWPPSFPANRRRAAFERFHLAAAHGIAAAVLGDDRGNLLAVLLVGSGVRDFDFGNHVSGHGFSSRATAWRRGRARRTRR